VSAVRLRRLASAAQRMGVLCAVAALAALLAVGPPGSPARAASGNSYDQLTGVGSTESAITVPWTQGILDSTNQPIATANAERTAATPPVPCSFMCADFQGLSVTVSQTQNITQQGLTVSWTGGQPSSISAGPQDNYLQMMECYGDSSSGPDPEDCEYGSTGLFTGPSQGPSGREGDLCAPGVASTSSPLPGISGDSYVYGCDPEEPGSSSPADIAPCPGDDCSGLPPSSYSIPFIPVSDPSSPVYGVVDITQYFNQFNTNEVQEAVTDSHGDGQVQFETLTGTQAPGLGCGEPESDGSTRNCWLVIVPRGQYEPNGYKINTNGTAGPVSAMASSPLSASNWSMRIQIHLGYAPVQAFCPIGTQELETVGTQLISRAVASWQLALNNQANCTKIYGFSAVPEETSTTQLSDPAAGSGLAFTTIPIGSEANRGTSAAGTPTVTDVLYAPVAISAVDFGFNISQGAGYVSTPIKLTPQLVAQALTQVYRTDLPDFYPALQGFPGPTWSQSNPLNISKDTQFAALNPEVLGTATSQPLAPLLTEDHSSVNQQVWQWLQGDTSAVAWLDGSSPAGDTVAADPSYTALDLGQSSAADSFPRAYGTCLNLGTFTSPGQAAKPETRCSLDLLAYVNNYDDAAAKIVTAYNPVAGAWDPNAIGPDGTLGWWQKFSPEPPGFRFVWGLSDMADLAAYGVTGAELCDDSGSTCVSPTTASVTTALNSATADSTGLLQVNPAKPGTGGWPLTQVVYAAVSTDQDPQALSDYADLIAYAAGQGQTAGVAPGDLPPGYLPLPASLQSQAQAVVAQLRALASPSPSASASPSGSASTSPSGGSLSASPGGALTSTPSVSPTLPYATTPPTAELAATTTPRQPVGAIRWVLLAVALAGGAAAAGGTVLRSARVPRWLHRLRP
jgi:hypothetical protein